MKRLAVAGRALAVCVVALAICGCGSGGSTEVTPSGTVRTMPGIITRGETFLAPSETKRKINRWALFELEHCGNGSCYPLPATWSSSGGRLRVERSQAKARFEASSPGTYTITASCCGVSYQSTAKVRDKGATSQ